MDLNNLFAGVTLPGWAVAAGGLGIVMLLLLVMRPKGSLAAVAQLAVVAVIGGAAYFGLKQFEDNSRFVERKAIEDRALTVFSQASQPGSVFGCLNAAAPTLDEACEKAIFAEPQRIASAISVTADRIALLYDATVFAARDPGFLERFDHLRKSLEADPFGLVAHVLATEHKCIPDSFARYRILKDTDKVKANLSSRKFDGLLAKYKGGWVNVRPGMNFGEMNAMPPVNTIGGKVNDKELPSANTAVQMNAPSGLTSNTPVIVPPAPQAQQQQPPQTPPIANTNEQPAATPASIPQNQTTPPPANNAKQKAAPAAQQKQQPPSAQAKKKGPPEPVGGLPRVTARGSNPPADDDDDDTPAASPPPPQQQSPFPNIFRR